MIDVFRIHDAVDFQCKTISRFSKCSPTTTIATSSIVGAFRRLSFCDYQTAFGLNRLWLNGTFQCCWFWFHRFRSTSFHALTYPCISLTSSIVSSTTYVITSNNCWHFFLTWFNFIQLLIKENYCILLYNQVLYWL